MESSKHETKPPDDQDLYFPAQSANHPKATLRVFLIGMMGAGKSFWANVLEGMLNIPSYDLDSYIEKKLSKTIAALFDSEGEPYFRSVERDALLSFGDMQQFVLSCGGGTPCFHGNIEWMNKQGITIWIDEPVEVLAKRLMHTAPIRPLIKNMEKEALVTYLTSLVQERSPYFNLATYRLKGPTTLDSFKQIFSDHA